MKESPEVRNSERVPGIEIERKYLLDSENDARRLEEKIKILFPDAYLVGAWSETSYYLSRVTKEKARQLLSMVMRSRREEGPDLLAKLDMVPDGIPIQMRFRHRKNHWDSSFTLTFKASANPLHDIERIEINTSDISNKYLEGFAANGVKPDSTWHSMRREYAIDDNTKIDVQNVTGYGWTAEIESRDETSVETTARVLGLRPLSQGLLDAMYKRYNEHWQEYYGGEGELRHFGQDDWIEIEAAAKESPIRNKID